MMEHLRQGCRGSANAHHICKVFNAIKETLKHITIVDEYLESHKLDSN